MALFARDKNKKVRISIRKAAKGQYFPKILNFALKLGKRKGKECKK